IDPLRLVPEQATLFVHLRVADLKKSKVFQLLPARDRDLALRDIAFGIPIEQVSSLTFAAVEPFGLGPFDAILGHGPRYLNAEPKYMRDGIRKDLSKDKLPFLIKDRLEKLDKERLEIPKEKAFRRAAQVQAKEFPIDLA